MIFNENWLRPTPKFPTYPPYHTGLYLEDYFIDFYFKNKIDSDRILIPISWTSYYNNGLDRNKLQTFLNSLPQDKKYFVVCTHDDAPTEKLPPDTLIFSGGGNITGENVIPIPLICSSIPNKISCVKDIFCSFVGSNTHPIRTKLYNTYSNKYTFIQDGWSPSISDDKLNAFISISSRSKFCLAPRGYGPTSYRLYEIMQLGSIPVYISDRHYLPWSDELDWNSFCVLLKENEIHNLDNILNDISDVKYEDLYNNMINVYSKYFTLDSVCYNITRRLK